LQRDFLKRAVEIMALEKCDVLVPKAAPLFGLVRGCYDYLDEYSYANRCCLYTREALIRLGGFQRGIYSYEDIELGIRVTLSDMKVRLTDELKYLHPPLFFSAISGAHLSLGHRKLLAPSLKLFLRRPKRKFLRQKGAGLLRPRAWANRSPAKKQRNLSARPGSCPAKASWKN